MFDCRLEQRVLAPFSAAQAGTPGHSVALAVILGVDDDALAALAGWIDRHLDFDMRVHGDVEDPPVFGKPSVRPAAQIANPDRRQRVDDEKRGLGV